MGEIFLILSVAFQTGATTQAVRLALRQRNLAWVFLALAIGLMLLRRSLTLYATYSLHRSADTLAEFLALLISLLMAIGMRFFWPG